MLRFKTIIKQVINNDEIGNHFPIRFTGVKFFQQTDKVLKPNKVA